jgi:pimeloyl-ACP methyl ester carboxylesterase
MTRIRQTAAAFVALVAVIAVSRPAPAKANEPLRVGTLTVQRHGERGSPIILVPGLASGGWVWDDLVGRLKADHVLFVVTLAGFDGTKPPEGDKPMLDQADASLLELIRTQRLDRPVLVGHSLGGTLSIRFAQRHPDQLSGVVAVDGLPVFPGTENLPPDKRAGMAERLRQQMASLTKEQFAAQQLQFMKLVGVMDEKRASELAEGTARSDQAAVARYMSEVAAFDLREQLPSIKVPVLEICPHNAADVSPFRPMTESQAADYYRSLLKGTPDVEVVTIAPSRHFVMFDQPAALADQVKQFVTKRARPK